MESKFLERAISIVKRNISNNVFTSEELSQLLFLSRSQLHRRLKAITGHNTSTFIKTIRLNHALTLLNTTELSVSQISVECGFSSLPWFSKCFKERFGNTPSSYREKG